MYYFIIFSLKKNGETFLTAALCSFSWWTSPLGENMRNRFIGSPAANSSLRFRISQCCRWWLLSCQLLIVPCREPIKLHLFQGLHVLHNEMQNYWVCSLWSLLQLIHGSIYIYTAFCSRQQWWAAMIYLITEFAVQVVPNLGCVLHWLSVHFQADSMFWSSYPWWERDDIILNQFRCWLNRGSEIM